MIQVSPDEYRVVSELLMKWAGICLGPSKQTLVESRLATRVNELGLKTFAEYARYLKKAPDERQVFINSMTTNKTDWFREFPHFEFLKNKILPEVVKNQRPLMVWSGASSTGEEIYSLAMLLAEQCGIGFDFRILGSDIDTEVLEAARAAVYRASIVQSQVPPHLITKYFIGEGEQLQIRHELKSHIKFREFNLVQGAWPVPIQFDLIFLRNVLIYFNQETIQAVINNVSRYLKPGGHLFIGHSEALNGIDHELKGIVPAVYQRAA